MHCELVKLLGFGAWSAICNAVRLSRGDEIFTRKARSPNLRI